MSSSGLTEGACAVVRGVQEPYALHLCMLERVRAWLASVGAMPATLLWDVVLGNDNDVDRCSHVPFFGGYESLQFCDCVWGSATLLFFSQGCNSRILTCSQRK